MSAYPSPDALVLVAVMPAVRDLEIARLLGWYRIRLKSAPKVIEVDYLAFYQPAAFGRQHGGLIESYAALRGHELVTRATLFRDEPHHPRAQEEYYKLSLGPLQALPQAIPAGKWKRMTFLYTTGARLSAARDFHDLVVQEEERAGLWRVLRERALQSGQYQVGDLPERALDPLLLEMLGGLLAGSGHG